MRTARVVGCFGCPYFRAGGWLTENRCLHRKQKIWDLDPRKPNEDGLDAFRVSRECALPHLAGTSGYMGPESSRLDIYPVDEVLWDVPDRISSRKAKDEGCMLEFHGETVNFATMSLRMFKLRGVKCVCCGVVGRYFAAERNDAGSVWQLRLYAIDYDGDEVLMTKDHIRPESRGGRTVLDNLQPMCVKCNGIKGNSVSGGSRNGRV